MLFSRNYKNQIISSQIVYPLRLFLIYDKLFWRLFGTCTDIQVDSYSRNNIWIKNIIQNKWNVTIASLENKTNTDQVSMDRPACTVRTLELQIVF